MSKKKLGRRTFLKGAAAAAAAGVVACSYRDESGRGDVPKRGAR
ncbi:MAG: twin-arginine translocation signal domain-containing protein [Planctomycetota bacterium]|jgi:anaerobic selenocysteine-containing dehydrogenase